MSLQAAVETTVVSAQSIAAAGNHTSSAHALDSDTFAMVAQIKADNNGTPASGDTLTVKVLYSNDGGTTYDTAGHGYTLPLLDTNTEDPAILTADLSRFIGASHLKAYAENNASSNGITFTFELRELLVPA